MAREAGSSTGAALLALARAAEQWLSAPGEEYAGEASFAVDAVAAECPELGEALHALAELRGDSVGAPAERARAASGCLAAAQWAEGQGAVGTALAWAGAAAAAAPENAECAYVVGRLARKLADHDGAERWLRHALRLARRDAAWEVYSRALGGLGNLHRQRGNLPRATRYHGLSLKAARRRGLPATFVGDALYDLAVMAFEMGAAPLGMAYAREALATYGPGHPRIPRLANDVAWFWMDRCGDFEHAASVFEALLPHAREPAQRLAVLANLARATAGAGHEARFEHAWVETWVQLRTSAVQESHAAALIQLAQAAGNAGAWERARMAAARALEVASTRREGKAIVMAEAVLQAVESEVMADEQVRQAFPDHRWRRGAADEILYAEAERLALHVTAALGAPAAKADGPDRG